MSDFPTSEKFNNTEWKSDNFCYYKNISVRKEKKIFSSGSSSWDNRMTVKYAEFYRRRASLRNQICDGWPSTTTTDANVATIERLIKIK